MSAIIEIDKEILKKTTDCKKNFECLNKDCNVLCKVVININQDVLFVKCLCKDICNYQMFYGYETICTCPTRKEIFNKYSI